MQSAAWPNESEFTRKEVAEMNTKAYQAPEILEIGLAQNVVQGAGFPDDETEEPYLKIMSLIDSEED
jgi:hypothetical protein